MVSLGSAAEVKPEPFALGTFSRDAGAQFPGVVLDDRVRPLATYRSLHDVLDDWPRAFMAIRDGVAGLAGALENEVLPLESLRTHAPLPRPGTVYCSGANYRKHVAQLIVAHQKGDETQQMTPDQKFEWAMKLMARRAETGTPFIFVKPQSAVTGPFDPIAVPDVSEKPDWELELAVIIGRTARRVSREHALDYVAGYTIANDITLRSKVFRRPTDSPELGMDFVVSKGAPGFLPLGPYLVPAAFVPDPQKLRLTLKLNGDVMQDEETADMIFSVAHLIEYLSAGVELRPGRCDLHRVAFGQRRSLRTIHSGRGRAGRRDHGARRTAQSLSSRSSLTPQIQADRDERQGGERRGDGEQGHDRGFRNSGSEPGSDQDRCDHRSESSDALRPADADRAQIVRIEARPV